MNNHRIAQALNSLSLAIGELAEALDSPEAVRPAGPQPSAFAPADEALEALLDEEYGPRSQPHAVAPAEVAGVDKGVCPKHHTAWKDGRYGPFCSRKSDDPAWSKNGFCSITPKNAPKWLEIQAAAAA